MTALARTSLLPPTSSMRNLTGKFFQVTFSLLQAKGSRESYLIHIAQDITEHRRAMAALQESQEPFTTTSLARKIREVLEHH